MQVFNTLNFGFYVISNSKNTELDFYEMAIDLSATLSVDNHYNADADGNRGISKEFLEDLDFEFPSYCFDILGKRVLFDKKFDFCDEDGNKMSLDQIIMKIKQEADLLEWTFPSRSDFSDD